VNYLRKNNKVRNIVAEDRQKFYSQQYYNILSVFLVLLF